MAANWCVLVGLLVMIDAQSNTLSCNENDTFKIIQFTDCHFGEASSKDQESVTSFVDLLGYESPDLIALTGDFVSGYAYNGTQGLFKGMYII